MLIRNAKILTMAGQTIENGDILIQDGIIAGVGQNLLLPTNETIFDASGMWALPGFIDAHTHIGMWEDGIGEEGADGNEMTHPVTPQMRAIDAVYPWDRCFTEALQNGITTVATGPGSANVISGQFCALKTYGNSVESMLVRAPLSMKVALGENPKRVYSEKKQAPSTRMGSAAILREALFQAREYQNAGKNDGKFDIKMESLLPVLRRELPLKIHAHRADDIMTAIRICKEFDLKFSIEHCTEGYLIPDAIKESGAMPIVGPLICERSKIELRNLSMEAPRRLWEAGIEFAIMTDHPVIPQQYLPVCAALAVREGLPHDIALAAITINAAKAIGLENLIGSIEVGKHADIALFDGHPLDFQTHAKAVFVNGFLVFEAK